MQRLYFLTPNAVSTASITNELNRNGIHRDCVHVVAKNQILLEKLDMNKAQLRHTSDAKNAAKRGVVTGALIGAVAGIIAVLYLPMEQTMAVTLTILGLALFGALFGIWASTLIGVSIKDVKVKKYEKELDQGYLLMMVDVPAERDNEIASLIRQHHPEATIETVTVAEEREAARPGI